MRKKRVIVVLLGLSGAFETIDHDILKQVLGYVVQHSPGTGHIWVKIANTMSEPRTLTLRMPQASVLDPVLFTIYSAPTAT